MRWFQTTQNRYIPEVHLTQLFVSERVSGTWSVWDGNSAHVLGDYTSQLDADNTLTALMSDIGVESV